MVFGTITPRDAQKPNKINKPIPTPTTTSTPPTPPPKLHFPNSVHYPRNKHDCLTRYVFPSLRPPPTTRLSTPDLHAALDLLLPGTTLKVHFHTGLFPLIQSHITSTISVEQYTALSRVRDDSTTTDSHTSYASDVDSWAKSISLAHAEARKPSIKSECALVDMWFDLLAEPVNDLLQSTSTYLHPRESGRWFHRTGQAGDWIAMMGGKARGFVKWKMAFGNADLELLSKTALGGHDRTAKVQVSKGFEIGVRGGKVVNSAGISVNPVYACLLAWSHSHFYHCRWGVIFNGSVAVLTYLAKPDSLYVSDPIYRDAGRVGGGVTIAMVMAAMCLLGEGDECRPSVTMNEEAQMYYARPPARV